MYIGPWQEYRLAKIQDDAIQRIRQEWEVNIRAQLSDGDDTRIRELMQPLMAKLPALLMAKKATDTTDTMTTMGTRKGRRPPATPHSHTSTRPSTAVSTASSTTRHLDRAGTTKSREGPSNQETHEDETGSTKPRRLLTRQPSSKKPKKKKDGHTTALDDVARRRKLFATWMKAQQEQTVPAAVGTEALERNGQEELSTRLPPLSTPTPQTTTNLLPATPQTDSIRLPPLTPSAMASSLEFEGPEVPSPREEPNPDDSLDEDEVNQLLSWTDTLLSPNALETSLAGLDDEG